MERNEKEEKEGVGGVIREGGKERRRKGKEGWEEKRRTGMNEKGEMKVSTERRGRRGEKGKACLERNDEEKE